MSGYRRFVAYVYEYPQGKKGNGKGFIKVEARDGLCRMHYRLTGIYGRVSVPARIYGYVRRNQECRGIFLGNCDLAGDTIQFEREMSEENMGGSGYELADLCGLILLSDTGDMYGSGWDDKPVNLREIRFPDEKSSGILAADTEMRAAEKEEAEVPECTLPDAVRVEASAEDEGEEEAQQNERFCMDEDENCGEGMPEEGRMSEPGEPPEEGKILLPDREDEPDRMPEMPEMREKPEMGGMCKTGEVPETGGMPQRGEMFQPGRMPEAEGMPQTGEIPETERVLQPDKMPEWRRMPQRGETPESERVPERRKMPQRREMPESERVPERRRMPQREETPKSERVPERGRMPESERMPDLGRMPQREEMTDRVEMRQPEGIPEQSERAGESEERFFDDVNQRRRPAQAIGQPLSADRENFILFCDNGISDCRKITPADFRMLSRRDRGLLENNFLRHGFSQYGHLLLGRREEDDRYILGVPGVYDRQEAFMAGMFGFPYFKETGGMGNSGRRFGYWYRLIDTPNMDGNEA